LALIGPSVTDAVVSPIIFVVVDSRTIFGPLVLYLFGGERDDAARLGEGLARRAQ
jgi:hypothetical protein